MRYKNHKRNYAIPSGREQALEDFLNQTHQGKRHKQAHKDNPNSEDALTWSCFEVLASLPFAKKCAVLGEVFEDAYEGKENPIFCNLKEDDLQIYVGKEYTGRSTGESTELDASIELPGALVFVEAKLYSSMSVATADKRDQIARKLRVGLDMPLGDKRDFYFIFLDIAPPKKLIETRHRGDPGNSGAGFKDKWKSAHIFAEYKRGEGLDAALEGIAAPSAQSVADNMGWLTWGCLFKSILRGIVTPL